MRALAVLAMSALLALQAPSASGQEEFRQHRDAARQCAAMRLSILDLVGERNGELWELGSDRNTDAPLQQWMVTETSNWVTMVLVRDLDLVWTEMQADRYLTTEMCRAFLYDFGVEALSIIEHVIVEEELPFRYDWENARSGFIDRWWYRSEALAVPVAGETRARSDNHPMPPAWRDHPDRR
jgi:hypothetical protein